MGKNILMILEQEFPPDDRVYKEAQTLIKNGFLVTIACYTFSDKPLRETFDGIEIIRKRIPKLIYKSSVAALKMPVYFNWWKKYISSIIKDEKIDIIHIHDLPLTAVGVYFKKHYGVKLVVDLHENWPSYLTVATHTNTFLGKLLSPNKDWVKYEKTILQKADSIITVVDEMKQRIANLGIADKKIFVLQNTIIPDQYPDLNHTKNHDFFSLFFAGGINIERGLQYVIPAISIIKDKIPQIRLDIVGNGSYKPNLEELVEENHLEDNVRFLGWKPLNEVLALTAQAHVSLIPHIKWEQTDCSSPNKLFQCMLTGVALVVSNINSVARIVNETKSGLVYEYDNINEFADRIIELYSNQLYLKELGENGKKAVLEEYNWNNTSKEFVAMYQNLTN